VAATGLLALVAVAGAGVYFISRHVQAETSSGTEAISSFDRITSALPDRRPLYELDPQERPQLTVPLGGLPASASKSSSLMIQAWNPDDQRLVRLALPFWLLKLGPDHMSVSRREHGFDFHQLQLDISELERIGPSLVLDYRNQDGLRVLLWTE
jgi:hypothetical protein